MSAEARPAPRSAPRASLGRVSALRNACASPSPFWAPPRAVEIGDLVRLEGSDLVGVLRYLGEVHSRPGVFAGIELVGDCAGRGKNDGTVDGCVQRRMCRAHQAVFSTSLRRRGTACLALRPRWSAPTPLRALPPSWAARRAQRAASLMRRTPPRHHAHRVLLAPGRAACRTLCQRARRAPRRRARAARRATASAPCARPHAACSRRCLLYTSPSPRDRG